ncbi:MAG TPA: SAM-dependent methyltransferase [Chlamydiales bacterium]|nr:SAM-dependent methyltransferase [Chlamydiales bacterium]
MLTSSKLILLPNVLDESLPADPFLPSSVQTIVSQLDGLIAESEKSARRYLRRFLSHERMAMLPLRLLNEHTSPKEKKALLEPILEGQTWGLLTDAGLPCIADPGSDLVAAARYFSIEVQGIPGPCSLLLALQLSGFSGQQFSFHGYLPRDAEELTQKVKELEARSQRGETQIWIETPYRSAKMLEFLKNTLLPKTLLCVAANLTTLQQKIGSYPVYQWRSFSFELGKEPAVFLTAKCS